MAALQAWRARQGLPVEQITPPITAAPPASKGPPTAPPRATPPPLAVPDVHEEAIDDAALLEEAHYDNEGGDFAMSFGGDVENDAESTAIGVGPSRDSFGGSTQPEPPPSPGRKRNNDW